MSSPRGLDGLNRQNFAMSTPAATLPSPELLPPLATTRGALAQPAKARIKPSVVRNSNVSRIRSPLLALPLSRFSSNHERRGRSTRFSATAVLPLRSQRWCGRRSHGWNRKAAGAVEPQFSVTTEPRPNPAGLFLLSADPQRCMIRQAFPDVHQVRRAGVQILSPQPRSARAGRGFSLERLTRPPRGR
jgi:hypothetical protein